MSGIGFPAQGPVYRPCRGPSVAGVRSPSAAGGGDIGQLASPAQADRPPALVSITSATTAVRPGAALLVTRQGYRTACAISPRPPFTDGMRAISFVSAVSIAL